MNVNEILSTAETIGVEFEEESNDENATKLLAEMELSSIFTAVLVESLH